MTHDADCRCLEASLPHFQLNDGAMDARRPYGPLRAVYDGSVCDDKSGLGGAGNTLRDLTHPPVLTGRGLAMKATHEPISPDATSANGVKGKPFYDLIDRKLGSAAKQIMQRAAAAGRPHETITVRRLAARFGHLGYECVWCGGPFEQVDHVIATSLGGPDVIDNLVPACADCNSRKADLPIGDWIDGKAYRTRKPCGTPSAYRRHRRAGENPCGDCQAANYEYQRAANGRSRARKQAREADASPPARTAPTRELVTYAGAVRISTKSRSTILRALARGDLSVARVADGRNWFDASEVRRVFAR